MSTQHGSDWNFTELSDGTAEPQMETVRPSAAWLAEHKSEKLEVLNLAEALFVMQYDNLSGTTYEDRAQVAIDAATIFRAKRKEYLESQ